jgi:hypothetical protein
MYLCPPRAARNEPEAGICDHGKARGRAGPELNELRGLNRRRASEVEALSEVDCVLPQKRECLGILDSLGDRLVAEPLGQAHDRLDRGLSALACYGRYWARRIKSRCFELTYGA